MPEIDEYELEVLSAFEKGQLKSVATKAEPQSRIAGSISACLQVT